MSGRRGRGGRFGSGGRGGARSGPGAIAVNRRVVVPQPVVNAPQRPHPAVGAPKTLDQRFSMLAQRRMEQTERVANNRYSTVMAKRTGQPRAQPVVAMPISQRGDRGRKGPARGATRGGGRGGGVAMATRPTAIARARPTAPRGGRTGRGDKGAARSAAKTAVATGRGRGRSTSVGRGRGGRNSRGRGKGGKGQKGEKITEEALDNDLENYMAGGEEEATDMET